MHVVVVGCGRVGTELAAQLESTGHTVAIIDKRTSAFRRLPEEFSGVKITGFGFDRDHLQAAGIEKAGALAAVTNGDTTNILTARVARENFGIERVVARIYDPRRALIYERLGIPTVATVTWTTDQVLRRLLPADDIAHSWVDTTGAISLIELPIPTSWQGKKLAPLNEGGHFWLTAITRFGKATITDAKVVGQEGDVLHFMVEKDSKTQLQALLDQGPES